MQGTDEPSTRNITSDGLPKLPLVLTRHEVMVLTDRIDNRDIVEGDPEKPSAIVPLARDVLDLLGGAYVELAPKGNNCKETVTLCITLEQAYLLRGKMKTGDMAYDGKTMIGWEFLVKIYNLIREFRTGMALLPVATNGEDHVFTPEHKKALAERNQDA